MEEKDFNNLVEKVETAVGNKITDAVKDALKGLDPVAAKELLEKELVTKEDLNKVFENDTFTSLKTALDGIEEKVNDLIDQVGDPKSTEKSFEDQVKDNIENLKLISKGDKSKKVVLKANATNASITNNTNAVRLPDIGQLARKARSLYNVLPKVTLADGNNKGQVKYIDWDQATASAAAAVIAEGGAFPEETAAFQEYTLPLRKVGSFLPVSEEFWEDQQQAAAELALFLDGNVNTAVDGQLSTGDGTGNNLSGLITSATAYTPAASGITDANLKDLVIKMHEGISKLYGGKYMPDVCVMNITTFNTYALKKDSQNRYLYDETSGMIGPCSVIIDNHMADNTLVVGDRRFATIYEKPGVEISEGFTGTQFTSDLMTLKARKRIALLVRTVDQTGWLYSDNVSADLTTLAT